VVRVVTRLVGRLAETIERPIKGFRNRTRAGRRRMLAIQRMTTTQRQAQQRGKYRELIGIAEDVVERARRGLHTRKARGKDLLSQMALEELRREIAHYCGLGERVIDQARRRVLQGEQVPNAEKIYSIFEPHTDLIKRGKVRSPVEFGHKVFLAESVASTSRPRRLRRGSICCCPLFASLGPDAKQPLHGGCWFGLIV
jgi:IS5 family transposase